MRTIVIWHSAEATALGGVENALFFPRHPIATPTRDVGGQAVDLPEEFWQEHASNKRGSVS
jgi:hypothetical protein